MTEGTKYREAVATSSPGLLEATLGNRIPIRLNPDGVASSFTPAYPT